MDNRKENIETLDEGIELMEQNSRHGQHPLDRVVEAVKKFTGIFNKGGGHCEPNTQGIQPTITWPRGPSRVEFEQAQKERSVAGIPLLIPFKDEQSSADKISALCDELRDYVLSKHNIEDISEIREVSDICHELKKFLLVKNERYGDSALKPIKVFSKGTPGDKIDTRMDDKVSRIVKSEEQRKNDFVDLAGYLVLKCIDKGWTDFSDLLD